MKAIVYLFVGLFCSIHAVAQEEPKFGQVPDEDVMMTVYAEDSSAEAVILGDYGVAYFTYLQSSGFMLKFERHTIIKILTKDGYKWADHEVGLYHNNGNNENFSGLKGFTYNYEDGKVVKTKLEKASVFREERNEYWDLQKFTMPDVKEGSVIEYTYSISSDFDFNLRSWQFQYDIPVRWSEYRTDVPEYFQYRKVTQGYHGFVINENTQKSGSLSITSVTRTGGNGKPISSSYQSNNVHYVEYSHRLAAQNVPAMRPEAFVASIDNYVQKIDYELQSIKFPNSRLQEYRTTWAKLNEEFDEHINFGQQLNNVFFLRNEIEAIGLSAKSDEEKIMLAFQLVRKNVAWNGYYSKYVTSGLKQAYDDKAGTVADINLLLTAILRKLELKADPVLVSTRQNGLVRENFPISSQFNYVICAVNMGEGGTVLLDATDRVIPIGYLPERCLNDKGWRVSKDGGGWVNLVPSKGWKRAVQATFDIG
ncbi:MAG: DUF3857 domain-containing protein, partial [Cyclobacteriaceae bacterium]|nr:DUF3857 domain-containing protein [Cyclobacteriaceae bacterium]